MRGLLPPPVGTSDWVTFSRDSYCVEKIGLAYYKKKVEIQVGR